METQNKRIIGIIIGVVFLLLIPLIAMQFSTELNWTIFDFIVAAVLLLGTGFLCEFVLRMVNHSKYRIAIILAILVALLLVWAELAIGIFGTPFAGS